jgi:hypothetical protein
MSFGIFSAGAQNAASPITSSTEWRLVAEKDNVQIFSTPADCSDIANGTSNEYLILKVVNANATPVKVNFSKNAWYNGNCSNCSGDSPERRIELVVAANESLVGSCDSKDKRLKVFSRMLRQEKARKLTKFEVVNLTVQMQSSSTAK